MLSKWRHNFRVNIILPILSAILVVEVRGNANFADGSHNYVKLTPSLTSSSVNLSFTSGTPSSTTATIYTGLVSGNIDISKSVSSNAVSFSTTDFTDNYLGFGVYEIRLQFSTYSLNTAVVYEQPITGFQVTVDPIVEINTNVTLIATFTQASDVEIEWHWNMAARQSDLDDHEGDLISITKYHTFTTIGSYNITVTAGNLVSRVHKFVSVLVQHPVNGFSINSDPGPHPTGVPIPIDVSLSASASEPMGVLDLNVSYSASSNIIVALTSTIISQIKAGTYAHEHSYSTQGNYSCILRIQSEISYQEFLFERYVWNNISSLSLDVSDGAAKGVGVPFTFINTPPTGFFYRIETGDGHVFNNTETFVYTAYSDPNIIYAYNEIGIYTITMVAWNPFYSATCTRTIIVQVPVQDLVLYPQNTEPPIMYPIPDGIVDFRYEMGNYHEDPTNVTCININMNDTVDTNLTYGKPILFSYTFTEVGIININVTCYNFISSVQMITNIEMLDATLDKFSLVYPYVTGMNMTKGEEPSDPAANPIFTYDPREVTFYVILERCVKFPPEVNIEFDFGDLSPFDYVPDIQVGANISHTYNKRGIFTVKLYITDWYNRSAVVDHSVKLGATDLLIDRYAGIIGESIFTFTVSGLGPGATYDLDVGNGVSTQLTSTNNQFEHTYSTYERFNAKVSAYNSTFLEITYSVLRHSAERVIEGEEIQIPVKTDLPPGVAIVNTTLPEGTLPLPFINCTYDMGDLIDRRIYHIYQNLSAQTPIVLDYKYMTLGNHTAKVNCSNSISFTAKNVTVNVWNECYQPTGIFDRDYSNETNPLVLYTSYDTDLGSRMAVYCTDQQVKYTWQFFTLDENGTYSLPYNYKPVVPPTGIIRFAKGTIEEGIYRVTLNVSLDKTWVHEPTFLRFVTPPPFSFIEGGSLKSVKLSKLTAIFDAFTGSYDLMYGVGANGNLTFTWSCRQFDSSNLFDLSTQYEAAENLGQVDTFPDCLPRLETLPDTNNGSLLLNLTVEAGYAVTVMVSLEGKNSTFTQLLQASMGQAPDVGIDCELNCDEKYAFKLKSQYQAVCFDCEPGEINYVNFRWRLQKSGVFIDDSLFASMTLTGIYNSSLAIKDQQLDENTVYKLWLYAYGGWGRTNEETMRGLTFRTNLVPYNGDCIASPSIGNASTTPFAIHCSGFLDEGGNLERNPVDDEIARNPLKYTYYVVEKYDNGITVENVKSALFYGGEMSATEIPLPLGDPEDDYGVILMVDVSDRFGDYVTIEMTVKVQPDVTMQPSNGDDTGPIAKLFQHFDNVYNITSHGGNSMSVARLVGATASVYGKVDVQLKPLPVEATTESSIINSNTNPFIDSSVNILGDSSAQTLLKEKNKMLVNIVNNSIPAADGGAPLLASDAQLVAGTVHKILENTDLVTEEVSVTAFASADILMKNIKRASAKKPFQMDELNSIMSSTSEVITSVDSNLDFLFGNNDENLNQALTIDTVRQELTDMYTTYRKDLYDVEVGSEENFEALVQKVYEQRRAERTKQEERSRVSQQSSNLLFDTVDTALNVTRDLIQYGEAPFVIKKKNVLLSVEKNSVDGFLMEGKLERSNVSILTNNITKRNDTASAIEIQVSVFEKSPVPHAKGDDKISSKCVVISSVDHEKNAIDLEREVTIPSPSNVHFNSYETTLNPEDPDQMMYFAFEVKDADDVSITYVHYENGEYPNTGIIYTAYFRSGDYPSSTEYDYMYDVTIDDLDPQENVLKIMAPAKTFRPGKAYLGLQPKNAASDITTASPLRRKRGLPDTVVNPMTANFSIVTATTGCRSYNASTGLWETNGCIVLPFSTLNETVCRCPSKTKMLATTFFVTPNTIDFNKVFGQFDIQNAAVYGTLIALLVLFIVLAVFLRRKDIADMSKWSLKFLYDCNSDDSFFYIISVHTGLRPGAGTESNVNFVLVGEDNDTGVRCLSDGEQQGFATASVKNFVMSTNVPLGPLTYFRLWHDNTGENGRNSWYLNKIIVDDPQTNRRYVFNCDKWLSLDFDDGMIERILPVLDTSNMDMENMFFQRSQTGFTENHLWLSLFVRPIRSVFTRVQRLGCGMTLLLLTMISNAMFFRSTAEESVTADAVRLGFFRISLTNLYISFIGILITTPPIFFASFVFRNTEPKKMHSKNKSETTEKSNANCCSRKKDRDQKMKTSSKDEEFLIFKSKKFPHYVVTVAWIVLFLSSAASAFFLLLYSMQWGKDKSEEWLSTFILSFVESFIFVDPIKVLVVAFLLTLIFRKHVDDETTFVDMNKLRQAASKNCKGNSELFLPFRQKVLSHSEPLPEEKLNEQRQRRRQELKAKEVFREIVLHIVFAVIVYLISYVNRDTRAYHLKQNIDNFIYESSKYQFGFTKINSAQSMMIWLESTFVPSFYPVQEYNGQSLSLQDKFYISDLNNVRIGVVRLRQVRMPTEKCNYWKLTGDRFCVSDFQTEREESGHFCTSWKNSSSGCPITDNSYLTQGAYKYKSGSELNGVSFIGEYDVYSAGGYVQDLPNNRDTVNNILQEIKDLKWLDRQTRAVMVEFSLYNANLNLVSYCTFAVEFTVAGIAVYHTFTQSFRPSLLTNATGAMSLIFYVIYIVILIMSSLKVIGKLRKHRCGFFTEAWNLVDICTCLLSYTAIGVWVVTFIHTKQALKRYYNDKSAFINFGHIISWEYTFNCIIGFIVFTATLRILKTLGYNKRCSEVVDVVRRATPELLSFVVIFGTAFFGFAILGFLLFGASMYDYHNLIATCGSLANTLIGRNSLDKMVAAAPLFAQFYFCIYVLFVIFVLLTMFAAILNQNITEVREDYKKEEVPIGVFDLMVGTAKDLIGLFGIRPRSNNKQQKTKMKYAAKIPKNAQIDTPNILQLVRETFDNADEKVDDEKVIPIKKDENDEISKEDKQYLIAPRTRSRLSRPRTPRDIDLGLASGLPRTPRDSDLRLSPLPVMNNQFAHNTYL